jgi:hypothetical protein
MTIVIFLYKDGLPCYNSRIYGHRATGKEYLMAKTAACAADGGAAHINTHARKNNNILLTHICLFCFLIIAFFYDFIYYLLFLPVLTAISLSFLFTILLRSQFDQTVVFQFTSSDKNSQQSSPLPLHSLQTPYKIEFLHCRVNP